MNKKNTLTVACLALAACAAAFTFHGCASTVSNLDPTGQVLPTVKGESLDDKPRILPGDLAGSPVVLLVGYVQGTQFDIDRWIKALMQQKTPARIFEIPTIDGLVPTMISGWIDEGMRGGIPEEDWPIVITVYGDQAARIVTFTGNENPRNARVMLLDPEGRVAWFHDRGFSAGRALALDAIARELSSR